MKRISILLYVFLAFSCSEDSLRDTIIKDPVISLSEIDEWIIDNLTSPYNIEVVYKWDDEETDVSKNLVPPTEDKVINFLNVLKTLWIDTYVKQVGDNFIKELSPKQILLIGSKSFNTDGTITGGTAEGGRKIVLYDINNFDSSSEDKVKTMIHVVHHEFAHIMHQIKDFGVEFGKVTPSGYTATWHNNTLKDARNAGFITNYAQMNTSEDFVEMISIFLTNTNEQWEAILAGVENPEGVKALREKEAIVADYLMQNYEINIYEFQKLTSSEIARIINL